jgi:hypothetical protein
MERSTSDGLVVTCCDFHNCVLLTCHACQVFVWEDRDEDVVDSYKTLEGHRSDILAMAAYAPRQLLATGERLGGTSRIRRRHQYMLTCSLLTASQAPWGPRVECLGNSSQTSYPSHPPRTDCHAGWLCR